MRRLRIILTIAALAFISAAVRAQGPGDDIVTTDGIFAVVNDVPITQQQIRDLILPEQKQIYDQYYRTQPGVFEQKSATLLHDASQELINRDIILHDFKESIKVPESILDEFVNERLADMIKDKYHGEAGLIKDLELKGMTKEELKQQIRENFIIEQMRMKFVPDPIISPKKVEEYYVLHRDNYKVEDQIKMRMIVLSTNSNEAAEQTRKRADEILSQIHAGASFADLAVSYSDGSTHMDGGETGWEDVSIVNKTLVDELNKLKPGQVSGVIEMSNGFYILLLEDRHPAHFKTLSEVREQIEHILAAVETDRLTSIWLNRLRKKTFVKYF
jgi:peptidyl-prolyl cis-trans isomerase SurA